MTWWTRFRSWLVSQGPDPADPTQSDFREFVYLDEVSVQSLVASRTGALAEQYVADQTEKVRADLEASAEGGLAPVVKGRTVGKVGTERSSASQVTRRAVIQSTFKELRESADSGLLLRSGPAVPEASLPRSVSDLERGLDEGRFKEWSLGTAELERGRMLEIDLVLEAEETFRMRSALDAMIEIAQGNPTLFPEVERQDLTQVGAIRRVFDQLLGDLVPIRGTAANHVVVGLSGKQWVVHRGLLARLEDENVIARPLSVVGVTEARLFWKDLRRVLFDGSRYTVYCRVGRDGIQASWKPIKLLGVLETVVPTIAETLGGGVSSFFEGFHDGLGESAEAGPVMADPWAETVAEYVAWLFGQAGVDLRSGANLVGTIQVDSLSVEPTVEGRIDFLTGVSNRLASSLLSAPQKEASSKKRMALLERAGLLPGSADLRGHLDGASPAPVPALAQAATEAFLDVEVVAIYW